MATPSASSTPAATAKHANGTKAAPVVDTSPIAANVGADAVAALVAVLSAYGIDLSADVTARGTDGKLTIRTTAMQARLVMFEAINTALATFEDAREATNVELARRYNSAKDSKGNSAAIKLFQLDARGVRLDPGAPAASIYLDWRVREVNGSGGEKVRCYPKVAPKARAAKSESATFNADSLDD